MYSYLNSECLYKQIYQIKELPAEEENNLILQAQDGDKLALEKVLVHNLKSIIQVIKPCYANNKFDENDLFQEGAIALMKAIKTFNPYKGAKFSTYAIYKIKKYINTYINKNTFALKVPLYLKYLINKLDSIEQQYLQENNNMYSFPKYLSKKLNIDEDKAELLISIHNENIIDIDGEEEE